MWRTVEGMKGVLWTLRGCYYVLAIVTTMHKKGFRGSAAAIEQYDIPPRPTPSVVIACSIVLWRSSSLVVQLVGKGEDAPSEGAPLAQ